MPIPATSISVTGPNGRSPLASKATRVNGRQVIYEEGGGSSGMNTYLADDQLYVGIWSSRSFISFIHLGTIQPDAWHDVSVVLDAAAGTVVGYLDGEISGSTDGAGILKSHGNNIGVGFNNSNTRFHDSAKSKTRASFSGSISNLAIYNRSLSTVEVQQLATGDAGAPMNGAPIANNDTAAVDADDQATISVLDNDSDPDGDSIQITAVTQGNHGAVSVNADHTISYQPNEGTGDVTDSFSYTISDGNGGTNTATVRVEISALTFENLAPVAVDDAISGQPGAKIKFKPLANDKDADGDSLRIVSITQGTQGKVGVNRAKGIIKYTARAGASGTDTFTYSITDGRGGTSTATVTVSLDESQTSFTNLRINLPSNSLRTNRNRKGVGQAYGQESKSKSKNIRLP